MIVTESNPASSNTHKNAEGINVRGAFLSKIYFPDKQHFYEYSTVWRINGEKPTLSKCFEKNEPCMFSKRIELNVLKCVDKIILKKIINQKNIDNPEK